MKKKLHLLICLNLLFLFSVKVSTAQNRTFCPAAPISVVVPQPDGTSITIVGKGNALISYTETLDGYTLVLNNGIYEYAQLAADGGLTTTHVKANDEEKRTASEKTFLSSTSRHLAMGQSKINEMVASAFSGSANSSIARSNSVNSLFPTKGKHKVLMLLIEYPDLKRTDSVSSISNVMNQANYKGTGSYHDYYMTNSTNQLDLTVDVFGWYTAKLPSAHYADANGYGVAAELGREAVDAAHQAGVNFSNYDNDGDGKVDGIMFVHAGPGAEVGSQKTLYIWSHRSRLASSGLSVTYDNVTIDDYMVQPERYNNKTIGIGVFCHEFGHSLGLPDLYDVDYSSTGVGDWSVMAGGVYLNNMATPCTFDAWSKIDLGWNKPTVIKGLGTYSLKAASTTQEVYRVNTPVKGEYYLLENKQRTGFDQYLPYHGMAIWHIDSTVACKFRLTGNNQVNAVDNHRGIDLVQADGRNDLSKPNAASDGSDLFPGTFKITKFNSTTKPGCITYNGQDGKVNIMNIKDSAKVVTFGMPLGTTPINESKLALYPNPSKGMFVISNDSPESAMAEIQNLAGQTVLQRELVSGANSIDASALPKGIYIVKITQNAQIIVDKISIQ